MAVNRHGQSMKRIGISNAPVFGGPHVPHLTTSLLTDDLHGSHRLIEVEFLALDCPSRLRVQYRYVAAGLFLGCFIFRMVQSDDDRPIALNVGLCLFGKRLNLDPSTHKLYV
jgi:hypothetical protein